MADRTAVLPRRTAHGLRSSGGYRGRVVALPSLALGLVVYALWPRWPDAPAAADAPSLPIVIGDVAVQRAAGRDPLQGAAPRRRAGARRSRVPVAVAANRPRPMKPLPTSPTPRRGCS